MIKISAIPLGFDLCRFQEAGKEAGMEFRKQWNISPERFVITTVGRLVPIKNQELFIQAIAELAKQHPGKICGLIVGDGNEKNKLLSLKYKCGLKDDELIFTSWIRETEQAYAASDLVVCTSLNEGTPVSLIEAMAAGKAVVSSKVGGVENIVGPECGYLFASEDLNELVLLLNKLIADKPLREKMGNAGSASIRNKFHYTRLVSETSSLYHTLLKTGR